MIEPMCVLNVGGMDIETSWEASILVEGLALLIKDKVLREQLARLVDGRPETALNCEAMTPKRKRSEGEPIRTPAHSWRGVSVKQALNYGIH